MGKKKAKGQGHATADVHLVLSAAVASRLRAFAGHFGRTYGAVVEDALAAHLRGFSVHVRGASAPSEGDGPAHPERAA